MRPVRLTIQAFGPYPERVVIDFRAAVEAGLFGIYVSLDLNWLAPKKYRCTQRPRLASSRLRGELLQRPFQP